VNEDSVNKTIDWSEHMTIDVLGTPYTIKYKSSKKDTILKEVDGYCDKTTKAIVIVNSNGNPHDFKAYQRKVLRHELIHAFMFESGLQESWEHPNRWNHDETTVDWFAVQFPKILKAYKKLKITD
jgi:hypothetical protein